MIKVITRTLIVGLAFAWSFPLMALESAIDKLNHFVATVETFQADFTQTVFDSNGQVMEEAKGTFALERPGRFRWDYQEPYPQHIVADGQRIWFYDVDLEQVTVNSQLEALADTPATLLSGENKPADKYLLTDLPSDDGMVWVELIPKKEETSFQTIVLAFDDVGLRQMIMKDSFDQQTRLVFNNVVENPKLADDLFVFLAPEGVDVVGEVSTNTIIEK
ncbi:MAG: outer membrane lipoprotein chaperone LolA [Gammaproteobacteria bacterium]|nr:outer membrane lipoprotein chaperone LolA [Gammaproteobacteria bacterium]